MLLWLVVLLCWCFCSCVVVVSSFGGGGADDVVVSFLHSSKISNVFALGMVESIYQKTCLVSHNEQCRERQARLYIYTLFTSYRQMSRCKSY